MTARVENWVRHDADGEQVASIDVAEDETLTVTYELAARVLEWLGFNKEAQGDSQPADPTHSRGNGEDCPICSSKALPYPFLCEEAI